MAGIPGGESLHKLVFAVLEHTVKELTEGRTVQPALIAQKGNGDSTITRYEATTTEGGVTAARKGAGGSGAERVAVRWDGMVDTGGEQHHAVYVLAQEVGQPRAHVFIQRHSAPGAAFELIGRPGYLGEQAPML